VESLHSSPRAPAAPAVEACLIAIEIFLNGAFRRRPLISVIATASATITVQRSRWLAERRRADQLGLTVLDVPRASQSQPMVKLALVPVHLAILLARKRRGMTAAPADWPLALAGKIVEEVDRRRSWRLAGAATGRNLR
jgi:hypothetical protein